MTTTQLYCLRTSYTSKVRYPRGSNNGGAFPYYPTFKFKLLKDLLHYENLMLNALAGSTHLIIQLRFEIILGMVRVKNKQDVFK